MSLSPAEEIVIVPPARSMPGYHFLKHVRLRHPKVRDATYDGHQADHSQNGGLDHTHTPKEES
jgi:hypothetical protein